mgnify:CR=1 FL=1
MRKNNFVKSCCLVYVWNDEKWEDVPLGCATKLVNVSFQLDGCLWMCHLSGCVSKFDILTFELEIIGEQEDGIQSIKWSPDGELVVMLGNVIQSEDALQLLSADFD